MATLSDLHFSHKKNEEPPRKKMCGRGGEHLPDELSVTLRFIGHPSTPPISPTGSTAIGCSSEVEMAHSSASLSTDSVVPLALSSHCLRPAFLSDRPDEAQSIHAHREDLSQREPCPSSPEVEVQLRGGGTDGKEINKC